MFKIRIKNFYSYKEETIDFTKKGLYLIYGINAHTKERNGVGKSAIIEAIKYVYFNEVKVESVDDLIRFGAKEMEVEITFTLDGIKYSIVRGRIKRKSSFVDIYVDGIRKEIETIKDTNLYIENLLKLNYEQFMHSFLYGQSEFDNLKDFTSTKLINFLKTILSLEKYEDYQDKAKEELEEIEIEINKLIGIKETLKKLPTINKNKKDLQKRLTDNLKTIEKAEEKIKGLESEVEGSRDGLQQNKSDLAKVMSDISRIEKQLTFIETNRKCPTCKEPLKNSTVKTTKKKELGDLQKGEVDLNQNVKEYAGELKANQKWLEDVEQIREKAIRVKIQIESDLKLLSEYGKFDIAKVEKQYKKLLDKKEVLEEVIKVFGSKGLPLYMLTRNIPQLELVINKVLEHLTDFKVRIITQEQLKTSSRLANVCKIKIFRGVNEYSLGQLSGGQEKLLNLAFRIGISKIFITRCDFDMLILDEVFGSLGEVNREKVILLIKYLRRVFSRIIVISHLDEVRDSFKNEATNLFIKYSKGISKVVYNRSEGEKLLI